MKRNCLSTYLLPAALACLVATLPVLAQGPPPPQQPYGEPNPPQYYPPQNFTGFTLPAGTWIAVRVNQRLSSDLNRPGDIVTATLTQPLVADGYVVARRGQLVTLRIADAQPGNRGRGTSSLALEITDLTMVDGQQLPVLTQWIQYEGPSSRGDDVATIVGVTGLGAAIGGVADGGRGAGIGALAGAAAAAIGVLSSRGKPVDILPESTLTFRMLQPLGINTERSLQAFLPVQQSDYDAPTPVLRQRVDARPRYAPAPAYFFEYRSFPRHYYRGSSIFFYPYASSYYYPPTYYAPNIVVAPRIYPRTYPRTYVAPRYAPAPRVVVSPRPRTNRVNAPRVVNRGHAGDRDGGRSSRGNNDRGNDRANRGGR